MNRKTGAVIGGIIGIIVISSIAVSGISAGSSASVEPTPQVAVATPDATAQPTAMPTPVVTPEPSESPIVVTPVEPAFVPPAPQLISLPKLSTKVAGATKVKYFSVKGESPAALIDNVVLRSKPSCKTSDTLACVNQRASIHWTERTRVATGACTIVAPSVVLKSTVSLPRWVSPKKVQPALLAWWKKMVDHMAWHEAQHIRIEKSYDSKLKNLMVGRKCSSANKIYKSWQRSLEKAQDKFDAKDALWQYPAYTGPGGFFGTL